MYLCSNCGKQLPENTKFCNHCGAPQQTVTVPNQETIEVKQEASAPKSKKKTNVKMIIGIILICVQFIALICGGDSLQFNAYTLGYAIGYCSFGIIGVILLINSRKDK